jgi:gamma-glutamyltranspeptidase/glutathione hydrolase
MRFYYRDVRLITAPPPSAGGVALAQILGQLELLGWKPDQPDSQHLLVEAMRRAYRDRAAWLGDPAYVDVPREALVSRSYLAGLIKDLDRTRVTPSANLAPAPEIAENTDTTHFSLIDAEGNRVAATLSINLPFGSGFMAPGSGVLLNDEMDDFAVSTEASNAYGLIGSIANRIDPAKRPLSSMTPTFAEGPEGLLIIGTPGGSRIITMVLLGLLDWIAGKPASEIVAAPRFHHQYLPDVIQHESSAFSAGSKARLAAMGHLLREYPEGYGNLQVVTWNPANGALQAAADPRGVGTGRVVTVAPPQR